MLTLIGGALLWPRDCFLGVLLVDDALSYGNNENSSLPVALLRTVSAVLGLSWVSLVFR